MSSRRPPDDDRLDRMIVEHLAAGTPASNPCPPPARLAGYAEGRIAGAQRAAIEEHLVGCAACGGVLAALVEESPTPAPTATRWWIPAAAAALLLLGVLAWMAGRAETTASTDTRLSRAAARLAESRPALFAGFTPLDRQARLAPAEASHRGEVRIVAPLGRLLDPRPTVAWAGARDDAAAEVALYDAEGSVLWRRSGTSPMAYPTDAPPLRAGAAGFLEVTVGDDAGSRRAQAGFEVASREEATQFEEARTAIEATEPELAALLTAHLALARGYLHAAREAAQRFVDAHPDDRVGRETLFQAASRLGDPAAGRVLGEGP